MKSDFWPYINKAPIQRIEAFISQIKELYLEEVVAHIQVNKSNKLKQRKKNN